MTVGVLGAGLLLPSLVQPSQDGGEGSSMGRPGHTDRPCTIQCQHGLDPVGLAGGALAAGGLRGRAQLTPGGVAQPQGAPWRALCRVLTAEEAPGQSPPGSERRLPHLRSTSRPQWAPPRQLLSMSGPTGPPGSAGIPVIHTGHPEGGVAGARPLRDSPVLCSPTRDSFRPRNSDAEGHPRPNP